MAEQQQIAPAPFAVKPSQAVAEEKKKSAPATTPTPQIPEPKHPFSDDAENERKKQRRTKQLVLLAGYYKYRSDKVGLDSMQAEFGLDRHEIDIFARVWRNVLATKDAARVKTLKDYYADNKSVYEPDWLGSEIERAEQELIAEPEQNQSNSPELEQGFTR